ncbi:unnamed protein product [Lactuca virosa]|uniref:Uncharacterized protein n=1 Tax=Lactuca virosa TaxID=75947 RepID=A0AAU9LZR0_9ASTR|nr:unnamed protein product [Lactuca virosa]
MRTFRLHHLPSVPVTATSPLYLQLRQNSETTSSVAASSTIAISASVFPTATALEQSISWFDVWSNRFRGLAFAINFKVTRTLC